jgi:hypothetical protein
VATVAGEMANHSCAKVPHPAYSRRLAICNFWLFGGLKKELQGLTIVIGDDPLEQMVTILQSIPQTTIKSVFAHWQERCRSAADCVGECQAGQSKNRCSDLYALFPESDAEDLLDTLDIMKSMTNDIITNIARIGIHQVTGNITNIIINNITNTSKP